MPTKTDLTDVTFLTLIRLDSIDRLENILLVTEFINKYFKTNILLLEVCAYNNKILSKLLPKNVKINFVENYDPIFHRTFYLNKIVKLANTPIISLWDSDVLVNKNQIESSVSLIRNNKADIVLPYRGKFLDTSMIVRELYIKRKELVVLKENENKMKELYAPSPNGGALFAKKNTYIESGMENTNFYGWGNHDGERLNRWNKLGYRVIRIEGSMYHLSHSRSLNSMYHSNKQGKIKRTELERLAMMTKSELKTEISKWQ